MIKALIFDLDGTLIDTLKDIMGAMNETLAHFSLSPQPITVYQALIGGGSKNMVQSLLSAFALSTSTSSSSHSSLLSIPSLVGDSFPNLDEVYAFYLRHYGENLIKKTVVYDGVIAALQQWQQQGIKLAVVTNKHHQQATYLLETLFDTDNAKGIHFSLLQGLGDEFSKKPAPDSTLHVLNQLNVKAYEALFIGDTVVDQQTANNAKVEFVFADWGYGRQDELIPQHKLNSISHIDELQHRLESAKCSLDKHDMNESVLATEGRK
ncbi:HAD family hydrolase [uncultured Shewanella sp.]|uniref:HAD family hydrolase n=1 Tax=uncultured Shewanella sp. TaxID=173975 RepID=UPI0026232210|nr:HAD family hydrolase [uncultured Shewanella sp.]